MVKCVVCYVVDGCGCVLWILLLVGVVFLLVKEDVLVINVILNGLVCVVVDGVLDLYCMLFFCSQLSDVEIVDVFSFICSSWGNYGGVVKVDDVKILCDCINLVSSNFIVLQMC